MKADNLEIYADGAGLMVGPTISKLSFYSVVDISENNGQKETEEELKAACIDYSVGSFPFIANSRAKTNGKYQI